MSARSVTQETARPGEPSAMSLSPREAAIRVAHPHRVSRQHDPGAVALLRVLRGSVQRPGGRISSARPTSHSFPLSCRWCRTTSVVSRLATDRSCRSRATRRTRTGYSTPPGTGCPEVPGAAMPKTTWARLPAGLRPTATTSATAASLRANWSSWLSVVVPTAMLVAPMLRSSERALGRPEPTPVEHPAVNGRERLAGEDQLVRRCIGGAMQIENALNQPVVVEITAAIADHTRC